MTEKFKYIVGRPFKTGEGQFMTGDTVSYETAENWHNLDAMISSGLLYLVSDSLKNIPAYLTPNIYSTEQVEALTEGGTSRSNVVPDVVNDAIITLDAEKLGIKQAEDKKLAIANKAVEIKREPVEETLTPKIPVPDSKKEQSEAEGNPFDPEKIKTLKLDALREEAKSRGIPTSGRSKPDLVQAIIDDEIEKAK